MTQPNWAKLRHAVKKYQASGPELKFWWRDDDATEPTPALDRLHRIAQNCAVPVHLAIIPKHAKPALATEVAQSSILVPLVHGWCHKNHAPPDQKKSEFGTIRPDAEQDLGIAMNHMQDLFGARLLPVFVPPWNRIAPECIQMLTLHGYRALSTFTPRAEQYAAPGLLRLNTHIDPIDWRGSRDLKDPEQLINETCALLEAHASGHTDKMEPLGYLTHHLVHSQALWEFSYRFISELCDAGATPRPLAPLLETPE